MSPSVVIPTFLALIFTLNAELGPAAFFVAAASASRVQHPASECVIATATAGFVSPPTSLPSFRCKGSVRIFTPYVSSKRTVSVASSRAVLAAKRKERNGPSAGGRENESSRTVSERRSSAVEDRRSAPIRKGRDDGGSNDDGVDSDNEEPAEIQRTLGGGSPLIFEMARRMLVWDDDLYKGRNDVGQRDGTAQERRRASPKTAKGNSASPRVIAPRWRPARMSGISNVNPSFRTEAPLMNNAGYAGVLRRNSRKRNKPSMWRHALRVYGEMGELERATKDGTDPRKETRTYGGDKASGAAAKVGTNGNGARGKKKLNIRRSASHHEAAMVAASKLGLWKEALRIYCTAEEGAKESKGRSASSPELVPSSENSPLKRTNRVVSEKMVLSLVVACVRGSRIKKARNGEGEARALTIEERRRPLNAARDVLYEMEELHEIPLMSRHITPLASAYLRLGLTTDASDLIKNNLPDRTPPPKEDNPYGDEYEYDDADVKLSNDGHHPMALDINNFQAKDRASYSLLVKGAVLDGDWAAAAEELRSMTEAGLHPNDRNLNSWVESSTRMRSAGGRGRNRRSWKKKRDGYWLEKWR